MATSSRCRVRHAPPSPSADAPDRRRERPLERLGIFGFITAAAVVGYLLASTLWADAVVLPYDNPNTRTVRRLTPP
jgi:hypothetical protein